VTDPRAGLALTRIETAMTEHHPTSLPLATLFACLALFGCDAFEPAGDDDDDDAETGGDDDDDADEPSDPSGADDDDDDTGSDPDTGSGPDSDSDTSDPGDALGDSVFVYIHQDGGNVDSVRAYDVATNETWVVSDFGGNTEINGVAIHPDRTTLAVSAFYQLEDADESEGIWRISAQGGEPENIMPALPGEDGEFQSVANLVYSPDGAHVWFDHGTSFGGGTIARVADSGGLPELFVDTNVGCAASGAPAPSPDGAQVYGVRGACQDFANEGLVAYGVPPTDGGQVVIPEGVSYDLHQQAPQWLADGSGLVYALGTRIDTDGDGMFDGQGDMLGLLELASGQSYEVVAPADGQLIDAFAVSPDESYVVLCMRNAAAGQDLVLLDLSGETPAYTTLTSDGASCRPAW
jgi:hypothetical protein